MAGPMLGTAYVQITPQAKGISGAISNLLGGEAESAGTSIGGKIGAFAKKAIIAAGIGTAAVKGIKASMAEGAKLQQSYFGGLDTLYGDAADKAREYARAASEAGISMNTYSEQAVSFGAALKNAYGGDTTKAIEAANKAILDMADNSAKMGTDIESVQMAYQGFAKQNYTILDNLKLGYGGTKTEMERLLADAEKLSGQTYSIDNLGDVYDAIHVIQQDLGLTGVAAAEAAETFSGSFNAMKAAAQNLLGSLAIGENVAPAMSQLVTSISTFFFGNFLPMLGTLISQIPSAIYTFLAQGIPLLVANLTNLLTSLTASLSAVANNLTASTISTWVTQNIPRIIKAGAQLIMKLATAFITNMPKIVSAIARIGLAIVTGLGSALWGKITAAANGIKDRFMKPIDSMKEKVKSTIDKIKSFFPFNIGKVMSNIQLPKFSLSGKFSLNPPSVPHIEVKWAAKGGIVDGATLIGAGEKGPEAIVPLDPLWKKLESLTASGGDNITINVYAREGMDINALATAVEQKLAQAQKRRQLAWQ